MAKSSDLFQCSSWHWLICVKAAAWHLSFDLLHQNPTDVPLRTFIFPLIVIVSSSFLGIPWNSLSTNNWSTSREFRVYSRLERKGYFSCLDTRSSFFGCDWNAKRRRYWGRGWKAWRTSKSTALPFGVISLFIPTDRSGVCISLT